MSYVTSITVVIESPHKELRDALLAESDFGRGGLPVALRELDMDAAGGSKYSGHRIFAAGINYADRDFLHEWLDALPWSSRNGVAFIDTEGNYPEVLTYPKAAA